jgi:predicted TPR repeat methyltransferase
VEAEEYFKRAVELAPHSSIWWYYYAYHLQAFSDRKPQALQAVETCLSLDPTNSAGVALRQQLVARP